MHIFFIDESGTPPGPGKLNDKYFVIGGLVIPEQVWHGLRDCLHGLKTRRKLVGELKWRYFAPGNTDAANPMASMKPDERNEIRQEMYQIICSCKSVKTMACVACIESAYNMPSVCNRDDLDFILFTDMPVHQRTSPGMKAVCQQQGSMDTLFR